MIRIILRGCCGHMGAVVDEIVSADSECEIVAGIDVFDNGKMSYPVYKTLGEVKEEADVLIDFSAPAGIEELLYSAKNRELPLVLCSTGYSPEQLQHINLMKDELAILRSANMSVGVNTVIKLLKLATEVLANDYDIEIVEKHHNRKKDAPSGTALALADAINEVLDEKYEYCYNRSNRSEARPKKEIGISAVRGGTIVGQHDVIYAGLDEVIEIRHTAYSRAIFAKGAVRAAKFLAGKPHGMYDMSDVIG